MRYLGGKSLLLDDIYAVINEIAPRAETIMDLFSGSGVVADFLKSKGYNVICNDQLYFSYVLLRGVTQISSEPSFSLLTATKDPIPFLNKLTLDESGIDLSDCFIYQNYAPHDECDRMYFSVENAIKIDIIRLTIEKWHKNKELTEDEYFYLLAALLSAVPYVSNIAGVYAAYLKHWDARALKPLELKKPDLVFSQKHVSSYNETYTDLLKKVKADVLYSDSPYNSREYLPNYHILETIARYDYPQVKGVTGMRDYRTQKSDFCSKSRAVQAFENMIRLANTRYVVISYNSEGLVSTDELCGICEKYAVPGTFWLKEIPYRRYKSKIPNNAGGLVEQIYCFEKKRNVFIKSPLNYIGGKYKLLPQITRYFPERINTFVDLFCGGCDVSANISAGTVYANDINNYVIGIFRKFQEMPENELLNAIDAIISRYSLSKENRDGYLSLRSDYNASVEKDPLELYALVCHSFNYQFRFNSAHEYNNPFGKDRSSFNSVMRENLIRFRKAVANVIFTNHSFRDFDYSILKRGDFLYADPPYLISTGSYNDGKRGFEGWTKNEDKELFSILDMLDGRGVRFALSNVSEHKGLKNDALIEWASGYQVHYIDSGYSNSSYHGKNTCSSTTEVLVTNY